MKTPTENAVPPRSAQWAVGSVLAVFASFALLVGCSTPAKQKWLAVFFDGVPVPGSKTNRPAVQYDEDGRPLTWVEAPKIDLTATNVPVFFHHAPYQNRECMECHLSKYATELKGPEKEVCFACHEDFLEPAQFKHQPVENGECSSCHDPHGSSFPKMVKIPGGQGCAECHEDYTRKFQHTPVANGECLSCHNPHAANEKGLLSMSLMKLCWECHDDFRKQAKFKHQPVENGECQSCHTAHDSDEPGLLLMNGQKLCFECHEEADMTKAPGHAQNGQKLCLECHNPHVGETHALLRELKSTVAPPTSGAVK